MNTSGHRLVFALLLLLAVGALVVTSYAFVLDWGAPARLSGLALTVLLWGLWTLSCRALMRADMEAAAGGPLSRPDAAMLRHHSLQGVVAVVFILSIFAAGWVVNAFPDAPVRWLGPALPAIVLVLWAIVFVRMVRAVDEMQQAIQARAVAIAGGGVVFAASVWGLFEHMLGAPQFPAFLLLPAFSVAYGTAMASLGSRQR